MLCCVYVVCYAIIPTFVNIFRWLYLSIFFCCWEGCTTVEVVPYKFEENTIALEGVKLGDESIQLTDCDNPWNIRVIQMKVKCYCDV